ncbi:hypothetical protein SODALDRAFT_196086 [Sodiomyces alkalinus F11]|uniref:Uncharacterized protein n=1 Tax=Sodiomyces alkalinus (strain CBS 110278 / VKM F-3762 / F11) TaxID=1314773 RepID=A0A3N2PSC4_SODAK|nr:hypothetical protein SODALDRAFT_196086 [Sodiomyces alkalinus F11]ROT37413.1 hypothetical protein SODALDRAFT_196086 [Sodiomyces alkalinus F11]
MSSIRSFALLLGASLCRAQLAAPSADVSAGPVVGLPSVVPEIPALPELPILPPLDNTNDEILPVVPEDGSPSPEVPEIGEPPLVNLPILEPPVVEIPPLEEDGREDVPVEFPIDQPVVEEPAVTEPEIDGGEVGVIIPGQDGIPEGARQGEQGAELRPLPGFQPPAGELLPLPIELPIIEEGGEGGDEDAIPPLDPLPSDAPELLDPLPSDIPELLDPLPSDAPELLDPLPSDAPEFLDPLPSDGLELLDPGQPIESTISADLAIPTDTISLPSGLPVSLS